MKSTGIVKKIDESGGIVLPIEVRRTINLDAKDSLEIYNKLICPKCIKILANKY